MNYYYLTNVKIKAGTPYKTTTDIEEVRRLAIGKKKDNLPAIWANGEKRSEFSKSDVFCIDIDTRKFTQDIIRNANDIIQKIPCIVFIQESFSGKIHIFCKHNKEYDDEESWVRATQIYSIAVCHMLYKLYGWDIIHAVNEDSVGKYDKNGNPLPPRPAFDESNWRSSQGLYVSSKTIYLNEDPIGFEISDEDVSRLYSEYPDKLYKENTYKKDIQNTSNPSIDLNQYDILTPKEKLYIDRNFSIGTISLGEKQIDLAGNELRWRIGSCLRKLLGSEDAAKKFVEEHFANPGDFTYYDKPTNQKVHSWLMGNYFQKKTLNIIPEGKFLNEYRYQVLDFWNEHRQMLLEGCTGLGKTVLIKWLSHKKKCIVIVPYNDMLCVYAGEQGEVNPIKQILSSANIKDFSNETSACVIWDQFYKIINQAKDYAIIVDECHVVGKSSNFRCSSNSLYYKLLQLKEENHEIMWVTATPTFEKELYNLTDADILSFDRNSVKRKVELCYNFQDEVKTKKNDQEIINTLHGKAHYRILGDVISAWKSKKYDYILVWSDQYNQFISTYLRLKDIPKEAIHQIHKEESKYNLQIREDMEKLKETETLEKGIYIFTQITENGFNFNNTEGKALIIIQDKLKNFAYDKIVQIIGRLRKLPYIYTKVYAEKEIEEELTVQDKHTRALIMVETNLELKNNPIYEHEEATIHNEYRVNYNQEHGTPEMIKKDMEEYLNGDKYQVILHDMSEENRLGKSSNKFKREQENEAWEILINENSEGNVMDKVYARHLKQEFDYLVGKYGKENIVNMVNILKKKAKSDKLYSTCLNEIEKYIPWLDDDYRTTQNEYFDKVFNQKIYGERFKITPKLYKHMMSDIKDRNRWVEKYKNCISIEDVIKQEEESLLDDLMELKVIRSNAHSIKHKQHKQKLLMLLEDGFTGTREQMAEHIGKNPDTVTRWKQSGKIVEVKASL